MTARRLPKPPFPDWISNGSDDTDAYGAGANPYNGNPKIIAPTSAEMHAGLNPSKATIGAQQHNWLFSRWSGMASSLVQGQMWNWRHVALPTSTNGVDIIAPVNWTVDSVNSIPVQAKMLVALLIDNSPDIVPQFSSGGHLFRAGTTTGLNTTSGSRGSDVCADYPNRVVIVSRLDRDVVYTTPSDLTAYTTVSNVTPASLGFGCIQSILAGFSNPRLVAGGRGITTEPTTTSRIFTSDDGGATWATVTVPSSWNTTAIHNIIAADEFGSNDSAMCAVGEQNTILNSIDAGDSWSEVTMPMDRPASSNGYQIAWSPVHRLFLAVGKDLEMAVSETGEEWSALSGTNDESDLVNSADEERGRMLACAGPCFALAVNWIAATGGAVMMRRGVLYSFDMQQWIFTDFGSTVEADNQLLGIREFNGGFVAWSQSDAWFSPPMWMPDPDFVRSGV